MPPREVPPRVRPARLEPGDFDDIREAVMETPRGRWFLDEFSARLRRAEASGLQESIRRLETAIASNHDEVMARLASVLNEEPEDRRAAVPIEAEPALAPRHMKYFRADEDVFEPAPEAAIAQAPRLVDILPPEPAAQAMRRRIIITRRKPGEAFDVPLADELPKAS
ncbi:MAG: hypothetical protein IOC82_13280 [Aestuariivirga sp.]|uniref:hypothetical protein n=1 Tax=Aestuariivirga sp. TaxID=2650926 RepID=UPI0025BB885B|nr:hypothetical protein [Aestuariivirga sp.]MCA3561991.1 hypothetical protein [Aestuariivirga sp.]